MLGEVSPDAGVTPKPSACSCAPCVAGVPRIAVEEALWTAAETSDVQLTDSIAGRVVPDVLKQSRTARSATRPDERAARRSLLDQIERLEAELSQLFCSTWPRKGFEWDVPGRGGPRLLSLASSRSCATTWPTAWPARAPRSRTGPTPRSRTAA